MRVHSYDINTVSDRYNKISRRKMSGNKPWSTTIIILLGLIINICCLTGIESRSISKKQIDHRRQQLTNMTHGSSHKMEMELHQQASSIVIVLFLFMTVGMFCCCRFLPELLI